MTIENNKVIVHQWVEAWMASDDLEALDKIFAQNYSVNGHHLGVKGVKQAVQFFHSALADISAELHELVGEGDTVVARWTVRGLQVGEFMGLPSTRKLLELRGINIYQIADGKIAANYEETNISEVLQRLKAEN